MADRGGSKRNGLRVGDERRGSGRGGGADRRGLQGEVDLLGPRGRAILACRLTERARDALNAKLDELWSMAADVDVMIARNEELVAAGADDAVRREARSLLNARRARVMCAKSEAAYMLAELHMWCDLAESLVVVHARHQDHGEAATQELWDVIGQVVEDRDRMRLAAT